MTTQTDFQARRRRGIGGSDVAAIAGLNPWKTPLQVWKEKVLGDTVEENAAMRWGTKLEPVILEAYGEEMKATVVQAAPVLDGYKMAHADGIAMFDDRRHIIEVKTSRTDKGWGQPGSDEVPDHYACQGQWYLARYGLDRVDFAVLVGASDFRIYSQPRLQTVIDNLERLAEKFWNENVLKEVPPDPVTSAEAAEVWRKTTGRSVVLPDDVLVALRNREVWKAQVKELEAQIEAAELTIKTTLRDNEAGTSADGAVVCTWKPQVSQRLDTARFKREMPDLYENYSNRFENRVLRVK